jgi:hypothetical protein
LGDDLPRLDEVVVEWMRKSKKSCSAQEIKALLRKPLPERERSSFTETMDLMEWTDAMFKGAFPSRRCPVPSYDPTTTIPIRLAADELEAILTKTRIAKTKKLRPRLEAMAADDKAIELDINDWSDVLLALCGAGAEKARSGKPFLAVAMHIANHLAESLGIDAPSMSVK